MMSIMFTFTIQGLNISYFVSTMDFNILVRVLVHFFPSNSTLQFYNCKLFLQQDDWQKEKRDFLQSLSRLSTLPKRNTNLSTSGLAGPALMPPSTFSPHTPSGLPSAEVMPIPNKTIIEKKSSVYAGVVRDLNDARGRSLPFKVRSRFSILSAISQLEVSTIQSLLSKNSILINSLKFVLCILRYITIIP